MLFQSVLGVFLASKQHKGVTRGPSIRIFNKEQPLGAISHRALRAQKAQHILMSGGKGQAPHADDYLILFGQELCYLVRRA